MNAKFDISKVKIETERLIIRECKKDELFSLYKNTTVPKNQLELSFHFCNVFAVTDKFTKNVIGEITLSTSPLLRKSEFSELKFLEISYFISPEHRGKGIASEAVKAFCEYCIKAFLLDGITATHLASNTASKKVLEKCGFNLVYKEFDKMHYIIYAKSVL